MHGPGAPVLTTWPTGCRPRRTARRVQGDVLPSGWGSLTAKATGGRADRTPVANNLRNARSRASVEWGVAVSDAAAGAVVSATSGGWSWDWSQLHAGQRAGSLAHRISPGASVPPVVVSADASPRPRVLPAPARTGGLHCPDAVKTFRTDLWLPPPGPVLHYPEHDT